MSVVLQLLICVSTAAIQVPIQVELSTRGLLRANPGQVKGPEAAGAFDGRTASRDDASHGPCPGVQRERTVRAILEQAPTQP